MEFKQITWLWLADYIANQKPKRFITSCNVIFGRYIPMLQMTAKNVPGGRLRVYDTAEECNAGKPRNGKQEIIDTIKNPVLSKVILDRWTISKLMEYNGNPHEYLKKTDFTVRCYHDGKLKWFRYRANYMMMTLGVTSDESAFDKISAANDLETACLEFVQLVQRNGKTLADLALRKLSASQNNKLKAEIKLHEQLIKKFSASLPDGFYSDTKVLKPKDTSFTNLTVQVGVLPLVAIYWVVGIVVTGIVTAYGISVLIKALKDVEMHKATVEDRYRAIMSITDVSQRDEELIKAAGGDTEVLKIKAKAEAKADTATSWLGEIKQIVIIAAVALAVKEFLPLFTKKK